MSAHQTGPLAAPVTMYRENLTAWLTGEEGRFVPPLRDQPRPGGPDRSQPSTRPSGDVVRGDPAQPRP